MITGDALIGGVAVKGTGGAIRAWNPSAQQAMEPEFHAVDNAQIDQACRLAEAAFDTFRALSDERRAVFLETIAELDSRLGRLRRLRDRHEGRSEAVLAAATHDLRAASAASP